VYTRKGNQGWKGVNTLRESRIDSRLKATKKGKGTGRVGGKERYEYTAKR